MIRRVLKWFGIAIGGVLLLLGVLVVLLLNGVVGPPKISPEAIASRVDRDPLRLKQAFSLPAASTYDKDLRWQSNGSLCGPASLVNVFRSMGDSVDSEAQVLEGTGKCRLGFCAMGLTLDELAEVARRSGRHKITVIRDLSLEAFREHLRRSNDPTRRYIVNFTRKAIFGAGGGHHSPIAGYLEDRDMVLVLDVNADFRPWLVEAERLYAATDTLDGDLERGLLLIE